MTPEKQIPVPYEDYAQSANSLFHFMPKSEFLKSILTNRVIVPRFCYENIEYLKVHMGEVYFKEAAILQKCFCDIPLHKLMDNFELNGVGEAYQSLNDTERMELMKNNTHPDYYGPYGIAFSKGWGENKSLQPVHYLNEKSIYTEEFIHLFDQALNAEDIPDEYANDMLNRLSFIKPLRGIMRRSVKREDKDNIIIDFKKNFHDEQEWRYVPGQDKLEAVKLERVIANPNVLQLHEIVTKINDNLMTENYRALWLDYSYDDIRYLIVPGQHARIDIIRAIMDIPGENFADKSRIEIEKYILISKILVLEQIRKDW